MDVEIGRREDKLPLERTLRALGDVHSSLKEFAKRESVVGNVALKANVKTVRHKARKLRKLSEGLSVLWDNTFDKV